MSNSSRDRSRSPRKNDEINKFIQQCKRSRSRSRSPHKNDKFSQYRQRGSRSPRANQRMLHSVNVVDFDDNTSAFEPCQIAFQPTSVEHWNDDRDQHSVHFQIALYYQKTKTDGIKWILLDFLYDRHIHMKNYWKITNQLNSSQVTYVREGLSLAITNMRGYVCSMVQHWLTDRDNNKNFCAWLRAVLH